MPRLFSCRFQAFSFVVLLVATCAVLAALATPIIAQNPVPLTNQPLVPDTAAPGGPGFTLTVNGTGFVVGSTVKWNGSPRATNFVSSSQVTATILASDIATASTASVTVVNPSPGGGSSIPLFFPIAVPEASVSFVKADFASGGGNINLVTADFDGDGKLDLATAEYYDGLVRIFLGNGDGTFRVGPTYSACNAHGLAVGDFNGDGIADLAVADAGCGEVTILLGNGDGTFTEGGSFSTGGDGTFAPYSVVVGDFNGDGKLDLVTADETLNKVSVLIGNGDGTFQPEAEYPSGGDSRKVVTGDFNRDGYLDIAVSSSAGLSILLGKGDGTFQPQIFYPLTTNDNPYMLTADLNGDGILDLAIANTAGSVSVLLGKGDGTFNDPTLYSTGGYSAAVAAADFFGNGVLDLLTTNYYTSTISLLPGNGDGTFGPYFSYPGDDGARGIAVGDFNGDGRLDVAVGDQFVDDISIYLQSSGGQGGLNIVNFDFGAVPIGCPSNGYAYQGATTVCTFDYPTQNFDGTPGFGWIIGGPVARHLNTDALEAGAGLMGPNTIFQPPPFTGLPFTQAAFLQDTGSFARQAVNFAAGSYTLSFYLGSRYSPPPFDGNQTVEALIDGNVVGTWTLSSFTPFTLQTASFTVNNSGSHTVEFMGVAQGDHTAFLSYVTISPTDRRRR